MNKSRIKLAVRLALKKDNQIILIASGLKKRLVYMLQLFSEHLTEEGIEFEHCFTSLTLTLQNGSKIEFKHFEPSEKVQGMQDQVFFDAVGQVDNEAIKEIIKRTRMLQGKHFSSNKII